MSNQDLGINVNVELDEAGFCNGVVFDALEVDLALCVNSLPARKALHLHGYHRTISVTEIKELPYKLAYKPTPSLGWTFKVYKLTSKKILHM